FDRVQQVEAGFEAGALDPHEGVDGAGGGEVLARAQADLAQPCRGLGADVAQARRRAHATASTQARAIASRPRPSIASKRAGIGLSRSSTPISRPSAATSGTTHSERDAESQAMCPGNALTSATSWVWRLLAAAPHTPLS